ncbi:MULTISPECIES: hypothetical protein [Streptomyces]|uniref:Uncharacterized protein n=1 Tax=Streptomyces rhizosphaericus TaxID=114699 RepID=A0A6G4AIS7_9ACTN|nr:MULTISPECIES: hypothetical protein [Streptomyces]MBA6438657.1 hypothetical protein [Streptomyces sp. GMR22]NEW73140.1 hypothetical protein [Streptomyces rhizosphaericus]
MTEDPRPTHPDRLGLAAPGPFDGALFSVRVAVPGPPAAEYRPAAGPIGGRV